jgi:hypothetical protein
MIILLGLIFANSLLILLCLDLLIYQGEAYDYKRER